MTNGRPIQATGPADTNHVDDEQAHTPGRLDSHGERRSGDTTRRIGTASRTAAYDGSLAQPASPERPLHASLETRAFLLTDDGGILAELPCVENSDPLILGRSQSADIRVIDPYVHRHHAEIRWDAERNVHTISHGGGENPTYVNRHKVRLPLMLVGGEKIQVGKTKLVYKIRR